MNTLQAKRPYCYYDDPGRLDMALADEMGRMIIARDPRGRVRAAGWDCADTRHAARRWLRYGLSIELVPTHVIRGLAQSSEFHVFATREPVGTVLEPQQAAAALQGF